MSQYMITFILLSLTYELSRGIPLTDAGEKSNINQSNEGVSLFPTQSQGKNTAVVFKTQAIHAFDQETISPDTGKLETRATSQTYGTTPKNSKEPKKPNVFWRVVSRCSSGLKKKPDNPNPKRSRPKSRSSSRKCHELCEKCGRWKKHKSKSIPTPSGHGPNRPHPTAPLPPEQRTGIRPERYQDICRYLEEYRRRYPQGADRPTRMRPERYDSSDRFGRERLYGAAAGFAADMWAREHMHGHGGYSGGHHGHGGYSGGYHGGGGHSGPYDDNDDGDLSSQLADLQSQGILPEGIGLDDAQAQLQHILEGGQSLANTGGDVCGCAQVITDCLGSLECPNLGDFCCCCSEECCLGILCGLLQCPD